MARLREKVESANTFNLIAHLALGVTLDHDRHVARLGVHIAADVGDPAGPVGQQLAEEVVAASLAGRVDDEEGLVGGVGDVFEEDGGVGGGEAGVGEVVGAGVFAGGGDGVAGDVDAEAGLEERGEGDGEEARAGVGVEEVFDGLGVFGVALGEGELADVVGEAGEDGVVVLEEGAGFVGEEVVVDVFDGGGVVVCYAALLFDVLVVLDADDVSRVGWAAVLLLLRGLWSAGAVFGDASGGLAHEECRALGVFSEVLRHASPLALKTLSHDIRTQRAVLDIHILALVLEGEPNGGHLCVRHSDLTPLVPRGGRKMRRQLCSVAVLHGRWEGLIDRRDQLRDQPREVGVRLFHNALLMRQLILVGHHLQLAPGAFAEVLAPDACIIALRAGFDDFEKVRETVGQGWEVAHDFHEGFIAGHGKRNDVDVIGVVGQRKPIARRRDLCDCDFDLGEVLRKGWWGRRGIGVLGIGFAGGLVLAEKRIDIGLKDFVKPVALGAVDLDLLAPFNGVIGFLGRILHYVRGHWRIAGCGSVLRRGVDEASHK